MKRRKNTHKKKPSKLRKLLRGVQDKRRPVVGPGSSDVASDEPVQTARVFDGGSQPGSAAAPGQDHTRFLAEMATSLWRLRQSMNQSDSGDPSEQMRWAYRHFESAWDVLTQAGVEVQDHTGALFDSGMSLRVVAFQPTPGIERERVTETIRPSIYYNNRSIQIGEVIVATPETQLAETGGKETTGQSVSFEDAGNIAEVFARQRERGGRN